MKIKPFIIQSLIAIVVIVVGIVVARSYLSDEVTPKRRMRVDSGILVEVIPVERQEHVVEITGTGQVEVSRRQSLKSEANGRVIWVSPEFYPGARIAKGTVIAKINTDDYEIKLSNAKIQLRQKEVALMLEEAKGRAAKNELEALKKTMSDTTLSEKEASLVRREPQLQNAIADVELSKNNLRQAQLDYNRSIIKCPYDAIVETANISLGDYVSGATAIGSVIATDEYWVHLSLNPSNVGWLGIGGDLDTLDAEVTYDLGGKTVSRKAHVKSVQPAVESLGRMVQVLLAIEDPLGAPQDSPLLVGAFVRAKIFAREPLNAIRLSRAHVREGNQAYVCTPENKLSIRNLTTPYRNDDYVFVTEGLEAGERVVTTLISSPVEGRKLRVKGETDVVGEVSDDVGRGGFGRGGGGFGGPR
ncbi:MAG: efflux RND transporter periplasmic adaptor subunit [Proteobacteria bacterium]|nr:efflux RND transporter periplasmic adaptor subunit [Pseudomonadota bacterium]